MVQYYSNPKEVIDFTGIKPKKLNLNDQKDKTAEQVLEETIEKWLIQIKDMIDRYIGKEYVDEDNIPGIIENVALRMAGNMVTVAMLRRNTSLIQSDNFDMGLIQDRIFTDAIKQDLDNTVKRENKIKAVGDEYIWD